MMFRELSRRRVQVQEGEGDEKEKRSKNLWKGLKTSGRSPHILIDFYEAHHLIIVIKNVHIGFGFIAVAAAPTSMKVDCRPSTLYDDTAWFEKCENWDVLGRYAW